MERKNNSWPFPCCAFLPQQTNKDKQSMLYVHVQLKYEQFLALATQGGNEAACAPFDPGAALLYGLPTVLQSVKMMDGLQIFCHLLMKNIWLSWPLVNTINVRTLWLCSSVGGSLPACKYYSATILTDFCSSARQTQLCQPCDVRLLLLLLYSESGSFPVSPGCC